MGKLQSKHVCKRRENPEGGTFAANVLTCQRDLERTGIHTHKIRIEQRRLSCLCEMHMADVQNSGIFHCRHSKTTHLVSGEGGGVKETRLPENKCPLRVALPPEKRGEDAKGSYVPFREPRRKNSNVDGRDYGVVQEGNTQQEWIFTLYDFDNTGKVTTEDISSLMQSIMEVVKVSAKQPPCSPTALRVKLVVDPSSNNGRGFRRDPRKEEVQREEEAGSQERTFHCMYENTERRNHYLDLAGIENYSSKFEDTDALSQEPRMEASSDQQRHPVVVRENCVPTKSRGRGISFLRSLRSQVKAVGGERGGAGGGGGKTSKLNGHHPSVWYRPPQPQLPLKHTQSRRLRSRAREAGSPPRTLRHLQQPGSVAQPWRERELLPNRPSSPGGMAPLAQRHEHHHYHEHHHHHHHHHRHPPPT